MEEQEEGAEGTTEVGRKRESRMGGIRGEGDARMERGEEGKWRKGGFEQALYL